MDVNKINGHSYYIKGGTNTGVYVFKDKSALVIDAGHTVGRGRRICTSLEENAMRPRYVYTTHEHFDHYEAFQGIKQTAPHVELIAHEMAKPYIENLYIGKAYLVSSAPSKFQGKRADESVKYFNVDIAVKDKLTIKDREFEIHHVPGHCMGQALMITDDRVCYLGDSVFDRTIMAKYDMPFLYSIDYQRKSLNKIKNLDFDYGLISHSKNVYNKSEIDKIIDENVEVLDRYESDIIEIVKTPMTREDILHQLLVINEIECNFETYHYNYSTMGAFLTSLADRDMIDYTYDQGKIFYYGI